MLGHFKYGSRSDHLLSRRDSEDKESCSQYYPDFIKPVRLPFLSTGYEGEDEARGETGPGTGMEQTSGLACSKGRNRPRSKEWSGLVGQHMGQSPVSSLQCPISVIKVTEWNTIWWQH